MPQAACILAWGVRVFGRIPACTATVQQRQQKAISLTTPLSLVTALGPCEKGVQFADSVLLHTRQHVGVDVHCHADLRVAEQFLNHLGVDTETEQEGCCAMT